MTGKLHDEAYYVMAVLSALPYVRAVEVEKPGGTPAIGLEMQRRTGLKTEVARKSPESA